MQRIVGRDGHFRAHAGHAIVGAAGDAVDIDLVVVHAQRAHVAITGHCRQVHIVDRERSTQRVTLHDSEADLRGGCWGVEQDTGNVQISRGRAATGHIGQCRAALVEGHLLPGCQVAVAGFYDEFFECAQSGIAVVEAQDQVGLQSCATQVHSTGQARLRGASGAGEYQAAALDLHVAGGGAAGHIIFLPVAGPAIAAILIAEGGTAEVVAVVQRHALIERETRRLGTCARGMTFTGNAIADIHVHHACDGLIQGQYHGAGIAGNEGIGGRAVVCSAITERAAATDQRPVAQIGIGREAHRAIVVGVHDMGQALMLAQADMNARGGADTGVAADLRQAEVADVAVFHHVQSINEQIGLIACGIEHAQFHVAQEEILGFFGHQIDLSDIVLREQSAGHRIEGDIGADRHHIVIAVTYGQNQLVHIAVRIGGVHTKVETLNHGVRIIQRVKVIGTFEEDGGRAVRVEDYQVVLREAQIVRAYGGVNARRGGKDDAAIVGDIHGRDVHVAGIGAAEFVRSVEEHRGGLQDRVIHHQVARTESQQFRTAADGAAGGSRDHDVAVLHQVHGICVIDVVAQRAVVEEHRRDVSDGVIDDVVVVLEIAQAADARLPTQGADGEQEFFLRGHGRADDLSDVGVVVVGRHQIEIEGARGHTRRVGDDVAVGASHVHREFNHGTRAYPQGCQIGGTAERGHQHRAGPAHRCHRRQEIHTDRFSIRDGNRCRRGVRTNVGDGQRVDALGTGLENPVHLLVDGQIGTHAAYHRGDAVHVVVVGQLVVQIVDVEIAAFQIVVVVELGRALTGVGVGKHAIGGGITAAAGVQQARGVLGIVGHKGKIGGAQYIHVNRDRGQRLAHAQLVIDVAARPGGGNIVGAGKGAGRQRDTARPATATDVAAGSEHHAGRQDVGHFHFAIGKAPIHTAVTVVGDGDLVGARAVHLELAHLSLLHLQIGQREVGDADDL